MLLGLSRATSRLPAKQKWLQPSLLLGTFLYLYAQVFSYRGIPFLLKGDQTFFWVYAQRVLRGEWPYRDFFQFTPPGTDLFFATLFKLFGPYIWVMNWAVILLGVALSWLCFQIAEQLMDQRMAAVTTLLFVVPVYSGRLDATHHWFSLFAVLLAVRVLMPERTAFRVAAAGALLGVGCFFTQTTGAAGVLAILVSLAWERFCSQRPWRAIVQQQVLLVLAFGLVWSAESAAFVLAAGWKQFWYFQVTYPARYVVAGFGFLSPGFTALTSWHGSPEFAQRLFVYVLVVAVCPLVLWHCWRKRHALSNGVQLVLLSTTGFLFLVEIASRMNWNRLYGVAMPAIILFFWWIDQTRRARLWSIAALLMMVAGVMVLQTRFRHHQTLIVVDSPAGRVAISPEDFEEFSWLGQHTKAGDPFFQSAWLNLYPPLGLHSPVFVDGLWPGKVTRPEFVTRTIQQLEQEQLKYILWTPRFSVRQRSDPPDQDHLGTFRAYLSSHYTRIHVFSNQDEVWERHPGT